MPEHRSPRPVPDLANRVARLGHAKRVSVTAADTEEAVQAAWAFFTERREAEPQEALDTPSEALRADTPNSTPGGVLDAVVEDGGCDAASSVLKRTGDTLARGWDATPESPSDEMGVCEVCGTPFPVNPCHAPRHRCCSPKCRARRYRRLKSSAKGEAGPVLVVLPDHVFPELVGPITRALDSHLIV